MYYINYFFIFAIIGHLIETIGTPGFKSGILYGWWTPVYGFGIVIILLIGKFLDKNEGFVLLREERHVFPSSRHRGRGAKKICVIGGNFVPLHSGL